MEKKLIDHKVSARWQVFTQDGKMVVSSTERRGPDAAVSDVFTSTSKREARNFADVEHAIEVARVIDGVIRKITTTTILTSITEEVPYEAKGGTDIE